MQISTRYATIHEALQHWRFSHFLRRRCIVWSQSHATVQTSVLTPAVRPLFGTWQRLVPEKCVFVRKYISGMVKCSFSKRESYSKTPCSERKARVSACKVWCWIYGPRTVSLVESLKCTTELCCFCRLKRVQFAWDYGMSRYDIWHRIQSQCFILPLYLLTLLTSLWD